MSDLNLEQALRDLPHTGRLVKDRHYRQVWRFEHAGRPFYLKFYPRGGFRDWFRRRFRGSPAMREFVRLQWLQKAHVPAPRAVACLMGFTIDNRKGDAVVLEGLEPSIQLDKYLHQFQMSGQEIPNRRHLAEELTSLLEKLGRAGLGHSDLHMGNILLKDDKLYLLDGYAVHKGGLRMADIQLLAFGIAPYTTRTELARAWSRLGPGGPLPARNAREPGILRNLLNRVFKNDRYSGHLQHGPWTGHFFRHAKYARRGSPASRLDISPKDWDDAFPLLLQQLESDQFEVLKRSPSGDVLAGDIVLGGHPLSVVIKRPRRKFWYRYLTEIGRGTRARRAWTKAWKLVVRNIPTAWPLLFVEKRSFGYATDALVVFERIPGRTLAQIDAHAEGRPRYHQLLHRCGAILRRLEQSGLHLYDSKAENWMVREDDKLGPVPMLIDVDSVRTLRQINSLRRMLRSLRENPRIHFTDADALALARGYSPFSSTTELAAMAGITQPLSTAHPASPINREGAAS